MSTPVHKPRDSEHPSPNEAEKTKVMGDGNPCRSEINLEFLAPCDRPGTLGRLGHYEVLEVLGQGGFGIVLRAFDETLQRVVAIKVLAPELAVTSPARKRFLREARASAQVRHENVVQVHAIQETPLPYIVMEYIPGENLQQRMDATGPLPAEEVVAIGIQIARGLAAAHEKELIHRDVKPDNVLLEKGVELKVKLTDFGLARAADDASLSKSGTVAGTPQYMAPEQARGERLDHRADLFSLGSVLYALASGRLSFRAENPMAVLKRVCEDTPRPIREIIPEAPQWLCDVIAKLHAKEPAKRYQTAREVVEALTKRQAPPMPRRFDKRRLLAGGVIVVALLALIAAVGIHIANQGGGDPADPGATAKKSNDDVKVPPKSSNRALKFDGKDHAVIAESLVRDEDSPVTLECWFNIPGPTPTYRTLVAFGGKYAVWIAHSAEPTNSIAPLSLRLPTDSFNLGAKILFGKWTHVALVYDQHETRFYLDGKLQSAGPRVDPPAKKNRRWSVGGFIIGSTRYETKGQPPLFGGLFGGQLDEIRVSKVARYVEENFTPQKRFEPDADTLALYHCDEGKGDRLIDASGNGHHAKLTGATWVEVAP